VQVSDRRVTYVNALGAPTNFDDTRNKAILYCSRFVIGYTGVANLGSDHGDLWPLEKFGTDVWLTNIKNVDSLSAQVAKSYNLDKAKADAEVKAFMGTRTF
jgi:hypothetical protein